jgi:hypothetical protein
MTFNRRLRSSVGFRRVADFADETPDILDPPSRGPRSKFDRFGVPPCLDARPKAGSSDAKSVQDGRQTDETLIPIPFNFVRFV